ncbi:MAG: ABC transporter permease [Flavobacteriaceae bacterium]
MLQHNLLLFFRNIKKNKITFFINIIGLAFGLTGVLLISLWVNDEISFDKFHKKNDRLYQVMHNLHENEEITTIPSVSGMLAKALITEFPEVESATMVWPPNFFDNEGLLSYKDTHLKALAQFVDNEFLKIMSFPLLEGNINTVFNEKTNLLVSESFANKFFGSLNNVVGTTVYWNDGGVSGNYLITGIFKDVPKNSSMQFDILMHHELLMDAHKYMTFWDSSNPYSYVLLKEGIKVEDFNNKIENFIKTKVKGSNSTLFIQKLTDRYLYSTYKNGKISGGRINYVQLFSLIALIILVISCINFMNLSTAKAAERLKEIGIKKVLGANRKKLIIQYYIESFLITIIGATLALLMGLLILPQFNSITDKNLTIDLSLEFIASFLVLILIAGFLAGSYPALYLSRLKTSDSLKGKIMRSFADIWVRKGLVIFQFSASIILIASVLIISQQINYIQSKNLGYDRNNVLSFNNNGIPENTYSTFLSQLEDIPGVVSSSSAYHNLIGNHGRTDAISWTGKQTDENVKFINLEMSAGFIETVGLEVVLGRSFDPNRLNENSKIIFNEKAIEAMGLENPIGKTIKLWDSKKKIIGVVKNFHAESLYEPIQPTFIQAYPMQNNTLVKIKDGAEKQVIVEIAELYRKFNKIYSFEYKFLDDNYQALYASEKRIATLSTYFAVIAIIISCLGLFGLAIFTASQRRKEIGIRKTLGQSQSQIIMLLSNEFAKTVGVSILIGLPIAFLLIKNWLSEFAYKIELRIEYFFLAALLTISVALVTVAAQALRAANKNPIDVLREE